MLVKDMKVDQIRKLADKLVHSSRNAFREAEAMGVTDTKTAGDTLLDRLNDEGEVFKCVECSVWTPDEERDFEDAALCVDCGDEQRAEEAEDEEESDDE